MALTQISTQGIKDGTITGSDLATNVDLVDDQKLRLGTDNDLEIFHASSTSFNQIQSASGVNTRIRQLGNGGSLYLAATNIFFQNHNNNQTFLHAVNNGSVKLNHSGNTKFETTSAGATITGALTTNTSGGNAVLGSHLDLGDNQKARFGASDDLQIYHDGSNSFIDDTGTGQLRLRSNQLLIQNAAGNANQIICTESGAVDLHHDGSKKLETTSAGVSVTGNLDLPDNTSGNASLRLGNSQDFFMNHNGTDSFIINNTGNLYLRDLNGNVHIQGKDSEEGIIVKADEGVELYYNNGKRFETTSSGVTVTGTVTATSFSGETVVGDTSPQLGGTLQSNGNMIRFADATGVNSNRLKFGTGDDLHVYHNGNNSTIRHEGTGSLLLTTVTGSIQLLNGSENMLVATPNGAVNLYHDNSKKFETTSSGIGVTVDSSETTRTSEDTVLIRNTNESASTCAGLVLRASGANSTFRISTQKHSSGSGAEFHLDNGTNARMQMSGDNGDIKFGVNGTMINTFTPGNANNTTGIGIEPRNGSVFLSRSGAACLRTNINTTDHNIVEFAREGTTRGRVFMQTTTVSYATSSDYRLKENQVLISDGITRLKTLKPYRFNFIEDPSKTVDGFFAHEVTAVPEAVSGTKDEVDKNGDPVHQGLDYGRITPLLTAALQEAISKIEVLETEVAALKAA